MTSFYDKIFRMNTKTKGTIYLLGSAIIWGFALVAQKTSLDYIGTFSYTAIRCTMGGLLLIPIIPMLEKTGGKTTKREILGGIVSGTVLSAAIVIQQYGLIYSPIGKAAFITALYILITPIMGLLVHKACGRNVWIAVVIALAGMYLLCMGDGMSGFDRGDTLLLISAFLYAGQVRSVDHFVQDCSPLRLTCVMLLTVGVVCTIGALIVDRDTTTMALVMDCWLPILYGGVLSACAAYTFQSVGQKYIEASVSALILSTETMFGLIAGFIFFHEILTGAEYAGCALMALAIFIAQFEQKKK